MQFSLLFLTALASLMPSTKAQTVTFGVGSLTSPAVWDIENAETNDVDIAFDLYGEDANLFGVTVADCSTAAGSWDGSVVGNAGGLTVTFVNNQAIVTNTYCVTVGLTFGSQGTIASRTFEIVVTADESGQVTLTENILDNALLAMGAGSQVDETSANNVNRVGGGITLSVVGTAPFYYGNNLQFLVTGYPAYHYEIVGHTPAALVAASNAGAAVGTTNIVLEVPLSYYESSAGLTVVLTVNWDVDGFRRLQEVDTQSQSTATYQEEVAMEVELAPLDDSGGFDVKIISITALTAGAAALLL